MCNLPVFFKPAADAKVHKLAIPFAVGCAVGGAVSALLMDNIRLRTERQRGGIVLMGRVFSGETDDAETADDDVGDCESRGDAACGNDNI